MRRRVRRAACLTMLVTLAACSGATTTISPTTVPTTPVATGSPRAQTGAWPTVAADPTAPGIPAFYTPPNPFPRAAPGTLIRWQAVTGVPGVPAGATVWRVLYHSTTIYGDDVAESGYVVTPSGSPPVGGWPVIAWAHGTTGYGRSCAPSLFTTSNGLGFVYLITGLTEYLHAGFAVAAADYKGLGAPGVHGYLIGEEEGRSVLDAARSARELPASHIGDIVVIYGHSQGGHAALFAGQLAPTYAPDLHVIGVVAAAPATGLRQFSGLAFSPEGGAILPFTLGIAWTWTHVYRNAKVSDVFTPAGARAAAAIVTKGCLGDVSAAIDARHLDPATVFRANAAENPALLAAVKQNDPGLVRTHAPILVLQGTADTTVPQFLTDYFVTHHACPIGDRIDYLHVTGGSHITIVARIPTILGWMQARLHGDTAPTTCGRPGDAGTLAP